MIKFDELSGFEWDSGNIMKNKLKHGLDWWTIEEVFLTFLYLLFMMKPTLKWKFDIIS
jgi:hypothetical protein